MAMRVTAGPARGRTRTLRGPQTPAPLAPTLASFNDYQTSATTWSGIPYGSETWNEETLGGLELAQVVDVYRPTGTPPPGGWRVVLWFHANSQDRVIQASGNLRDCVNELLAAGYVVIAIEFRHPGVNVTEVDAHNDIGRAVQFARSIGAAFGCDQANYYGLARSRGSLAIWQSLQADLMSPTAPTHAGRQSSLLRAVWAYNPQTTYRSAQYASLFVLAANQAAYLADEPDNPALGSAINSVATAPQPPWLALITEKPYYGAPQAYPGPADDVHFPDMVAALRDAYIARGLRSRVVDLDDIPSGEGYIGARHWFDAIAAGMDAQEAMVVATAKATNGDVFYTRPSGEGAFSDDAATTQAAVGQAAAVLANRGAGAAATQTVAADRPLVMAYGNGRALDFVDTSDVLATSVGTAATGTLIAAGQCGNSVFPAALVGNMPNANGTPGAVLRAAATNGMQVRINSASGNNNVAVAVTSANDPHVMEAWWDGTTLGLSVDGGTPTTTAQTVNPTSATGLGLGRHQAGAAGQPWKGPGVLWFHSPTALRASRRRAIGRFAAQLMNVTYPT